MKERAYTRNKLQTLLTVDSIISIFYSELNPNFNSRGEIHDFWEFIYVDKGKISIQTDHEQFILEKGEIYFHKPMEFHLHQAIPRTIASICVISFASDSPIIHTLARRKLQLPEHSFRVMSQIMKYGSMVFSSLVDTPETLYLVKGTDYPAYAEQMITNYLEIFLMEMIALADSPHIENAPTFSNTIIQNQAKELVISATEYLQENLFSKVMIPELCDYLGCSKTTLSVAFKACTGMSIIQYLNYLKIEKAKELIRLKNLNLTQIAELLNFCNISYFSNAFRQHTGMYPSEYAKSIKASDCIRYLHSERGQEI